MSKQVYPTRTFLLTLRTTDTPTGNSADRRLAMALKDLGRRHGFKCVRAVEEKEFINVKVEVKTDEATNGESKPE